jgi:hypothetical protein
VEIVRIAEIMKRIFAVLVLMTALTFPASAAYAQYVSPTPTEVAPSDTQQAVAPPQVGGQRFDRGLPVTGGDVLLFAVIGAGAVAAGAAVRYSSRDRRRA